MTLTTRRTCQMINLNKRWPQQSVPEAALKLESVTKSTQESQHLQFLKPLRIKKNSIYYLTSNANLVPASQMVNYLSLCLYASSPLGRAIHPKTASDCLYLKAGLSWKNEAPLVMEYCHLQRGRNTAIWTQSATTISWIRTKQWVVDSN